MPASLYPRDISDAQVASYVAACADYPDAPTDESIELHRCDWQDLQAHRHALRGIRSELVARGDDLSAADRDTLTVASRLLQNVNAELDARTAAGSREPRASASRRQTDPQASDRPGGAIRSGGDGHDAPRIGTGATGGIGAARVLACFTGGDNRAGWRDFGAFAQAVARKDPRLFNAASGMQTGVAADGGAAVPVGFLRDLMQASLEQEAVRPRARIIPMPTGTVALPRFNAQDRSIGKAGLTGKPTAEGATAATQKAKTDAIMLNATKLVVLVPTTLELVEDGGPAFTQLLSDFMAQAMAATVDDYLLTGNGTAQPLGILNSAAAVEVAKETSQVAATLVPANLAKMTARLAPGAFRNAVWLCHSSVLAQLFVLTQKVANRANSDDVGGFGPGWFSTAADGTMQLLSRPLIVTDRLPALGTVGDICLCDLSQYIVGQVGEARLAVDGSVGFKESEIWFRLVLRLDGQPALTAPITPRRGTDTLSPFVLLATRS